MPFSLHQGDALAVLSGLPDGCVDSVITDPPYNSGGRTAKERTTRSAKQKYTSADSKNDLADFTGENTEGVALVQRKRQRGTPIRVRSRRGN